MQINNTKKYIMMSGLYVPVQTFRRHLNRIKYASRMFNVIETAFGRILPEFDPAGYCQQWCTRILFRHNIICTRNI